MKKVAINGFGRIGRTFLRACLKREDLNFEIVAANDFKDLATQAHLLKYDSVHGVLQDEIEIGDNYLKVGRHKIHAISERNIENIDWGAHGADIVIESTGVFNDAEKAKYHKISGGAKKVIITAPAKNEDATFVVGINCNTYDPDKHHIISNASCTTNCLAPLIKPFLDIYGIEKGVMTTVHAYTGDQNIVDSKHKDLRRARAAAINMVPTSTGAAKAIALVLPELKGKLDGYAIRVPVADGSLTDVSLISKKHVKKDELLNIYKEYAENRMLGVMKYSDEPIVSSDIVGSYYSCIFDSDLVKVIDGNLVKLAGWYDNEMGYSNRVVDLCKKVASSV